MKRKINLSSLACAAAFAAGLSLPALADIHHADMRDFHRGVPAMLSAGTPPAPQK